MQYFKWISDDKKFFVEKFVGVITIDIFKMTEEHFLEATLNKKINILTDERDAVLQLTSEEAYELGQVSRQLFPQDIEIKMGVVIDQSKLEDSIVKYYMRGLRGSKHVSIKYSDSIDEIMKWQEANHHETNLVKTKLSEWKKEAAITR